MVERERPREPEAVPEKTWRAILRLGRSLALQDKSGKQLAQRALHPLGLGLDRLLGRRSLRGIPRKIQSTRGAFVGFFLDRFNRIHGFQFVEIVFHVMVRITEGHPLPHQLNRPVGGKHVG